MCLYVCAARFASLALDNLRLITGNHINQLDEIRRMFPVNNRECADLVIQIKILPEQTPSSVGLDAAAFFREVVARIAKSLNVADQVSFDSQSPLERGP